MRPLQTKIIETFLKWDDDDDEDNDDDDGEDDDGEDDDGEDDDDDGQPGGGGELAGKEEQNQLLGMRRGYLRQILDPRS